MAKTHEGGRSRREIIQLASGAGLGLLAEQYSFAASDFWNKKKAAEWTDDEKNEIRTKSPWAKKLADQAIKQADKAIGQQIDHLLLPGH